MARYTIQASGRFETESGQAIDISAKTYLAHGLEGEVFATKMTTPSGQPMVAKILRPHVLADGTYAQKLKAYPKDVPEGLVVPLELIYKDRKVAGFLMRRIADHRSWICNFVSRKHWESFGLNRILTILANQTTLLTQVHKKGMVVGDLNDMGILIDPYSLAVSMIDADSVQFGRYMCKVYSADFLDRLLAPDRLTYTRESDYYAWAVIAFQTLFRILPYNVYLNQITDRKKGISPYDINGYVLPNKESGPKWWRLIPDQVNDYFQDTFSGRTNLREPFPVEILNGMPVRLCPSCNRYYANENGCVCGHNEKYAGRKRPAKAHISPAAMVATPLDKEPVYHLRVTTPTSNTSANPASFEVAVKGPGIQAVTVDENKLMYVEKGRSSGLKDSWCREDKQVINTRAHSIPKFVILGDGRTLVIYPTNNSGISEVEIHSKGPVRGGLLVQNYHDAEPQVAADHERFYTLGTNCSVMLNGVLKLPGSLDPIRTVISACGDRLFTSSLIGDDEDAFIYTPVTNQVPIVVNLPQPKGKIQKVGTTSADRFGLILHYRVEDVQNGLLLRIWKIRVADGKVIEEKRLSATSTDDKVVVWNTWLFVRSGKELLRFALANIEGRAEKVWKWSEPNQSHPGTFVAGEKDLYYWNTENIYRVLLY